MYSKGDQGFGAGSPSARGTLLEMDRTPDVHLDAAGPSNMAQPGSESSSEVGRLGSFSLTATLRKGLSAYKQSRRFKIARNYALLEDHHWSVQVEAEPRIEPNLARMSMLDPSMLSAEARARRFGDLGHLLPISGNSRNVQVGHLSASLPYTCIACSAQLSLKSVPQACSARVSLLILQLRSAASTGA